MATALNRFVHEDNGQAEFADQTKAFLHELADLSHKHGIGIADAPTLFTLERDDFALAYDCDDESKLILA